MAYFTFVTSAILWLLLPTLAQASQLDKVFLEPTFTNGDVQIETTSIDGSLDGSKMRTSANRKSYDYWWFDLVSTTDNAAINIAFCNAGDIGNSQPLSVEISGVFANGSSFSHHVLASHGAVISNGPDGVEGHWYGTGASFRGTNLEKKHVEYNINFDSPELGVFGTIKLKSRAPAHYPCSANFPGSSQLLLPGFFWSNAIPDADTAVDLTINGTAVSFTGTGYHDKNWSNQTVLESPKFFDWGHARLGPYSLVWYDLLDNDNNEYQRSYIAKDDEIIIVSCWDESVVARPVGWDWPWPPARGLSYFNGMELRYDLNDGKTFVVNVHKEYLTYDKTGYSRASGTAKGGIEGQNETFEGKAMFGEFTYGLHYFT